MERKLNRISSLLADGLVDEALDELEDLETESVEDELLVEYLCLRGDVLAQAGRLDDALESYEEAQMLEPDHVHVLSGSARIYAQQSRFHEAERCLDRALALAPQCPTARFNLAMTRMYERDYESACELLEALAAEEEEPPDVMIQWGYALFELGRVEEALGKFRLAADRDPEDPRVQVCVGNCLTQLERWEEAEASYRRGKQLDEEDVEVYINWAVMLQTRGDWERADRLLRQALELDDGAADLWSQRGSVAFDAGEHERAERYYMRSLSSDPFWTFGFSGLARVALERGELAEARRLAHDALRADLSNQEALYVLRELAENSGRNREYSVLVSGLHRSGFRFQREMLVVSPTARGVERYVAEIENLCDDDVQWSVDSVQRLDGITRDPPGVYDCGVYQFFEPVQDGEPDV